MIWLNVNYLNEDVLIMILWCKNGFLLAFDISFSPQYHNISSISPYRIIIVVLLQQSHNLVRHFNQFIKSMKVLYNTNDVTETMPYPL